MSARGKVDDRSVQSFAAARRTLMANYDHPERLTDFCFPEVVNFNWARDWFDFYAASCSDIAAAGPSLSGTWREVSYRLLKSTSQEVSAVLLRDGVSPGDRIMIDMTASVDLYAVLLGILRIGGVVIPVHHGLHPDALAERHAVARPSRVISDRGGGLTGALGADTLVRWHETSGQLPDLDLSADAPAFGCFTSGTTGAPKLALHSNRSHSVAHLASLYWNRLDVGQRHLNISSPGWAKFFWSSFLVPLTAGATVVVRPEWLGPAEFEDFVAEHDVSSVCAPVVFLRETLSRASGSIRLDDLTSVGEIVPERLRQDAHCAWGVRLREGFGQTEATAMLGELAARPGRWSVLPGYRIELAMAEGEPAPRLNFGALAGGSFLGYLREDGTLTPPVLTPAGMQWTGDYATGALTDGTLRLLGRGDDVFRSNGHLVAPAELEVLFERHPAVRSAAVVPAETTDRGLVPVAFVVADHGSEAFDDAEVLRWVNERLPGEVDVVSLTVIEQLPRSINGKIQRSRLSQAAYQK